MAKQSTLYQFAANAEGIQFVWNNGEQDIIKFSELTGEALTGVLTNGIKQRAVDAMAIPRDTVTGRSAPDSEKIAAGREVLELLRQGLYNKPRGSGGGNAGGQLLRALCEAYPKREPAKLAEWLKSKTATEKEALRRDPVIKPILDRIIAERGSVVDTASMLAELDD